MLTFGLIVEGVYDVAALTEFIQKCAGDDIEVVPHPCGSKSTLMKKLPLFLERFRHAKAGAPVDKALVIRDADNQNANALIRQMRDSSHNREYPFPVEPLVVVQTLEAWLLADNEALSAVCGQIVPEVHEIIESIFDPKTRLKQILSHASIAYTDRIAREIAARTNLETIAYRCPSFRNFRQAVRPV